MPNSLSKNYARQTRLLSRQLFCLCVTAVVSLSTQIANAESADAQAQEKGLQPVTLVLSGLSPNEGPLWVTVFSGKKAWLKDALKELEFPREVTADTQVQEVQFQLGPGEYGLSVYHDLDSDGELKTNFIGIPREPVGMSNNAAASFGPPKYKDARFVVADQPLTLEITLAEF